MGELIYSGFLKLGSNGEEDDILFLSSLYDPLAEEFEDSIANRNVKARYYISDKEVTLEEAEQYFVRRLFGEIRVKYSVAYSEITGYLWTNEDIIIGGHDLLEELKSHVGKYLILIIDIEPK